MSAAYPPDQPHYGPPPGSPPPGPPPGQPYGPPGQPYVPPGQPYGPPGPQSYGQGPRQPYGPPGPPPGVSWGPPPGQPAGPPGWPAPPVAPRADRPGLRRLIGALLTLPAFVLLIVSYVWPTWWTVWNSFRDVKAFDLPGGGGAVGMRNYQAAFRAGLLGHFGYALTLALVPLLVVVLVAPALAWGAHRAGTAARWVVRVALALPLVAYVPSALAVGDWLDRAHATNPRPPTTWGNVTTTVYLAAFGLGCAVAVTAYLATFRRRTPNQPIVPGVLVAGGVLALASIALALQEFTFSYALGGTRLGTTPMVQVYRSSFLNMQFGVGAATATVLMVPLAVLGVAAAVLLIASRARIEVDQTYRSADEPPTWTGARVVAAVAGGALLVVVLVLVVRSLAPWLSRLGGTAMPHADGSAVVRTWLPPLLTAFVGVAAAVLAAVGIGALRPLGRRSEWLLLPFAPWLLMGSGPFVLSGFVNQNHDHVGSFSALAPQTWLAIPVLFLATLLIRGQARRWSTAARGATTVLRTLVLPVLPMLPLLFGAVWLWQAQDLPWQLTMAVDPIQSTVPVVLFETAMGAFLPGADVSLAAAFPLALLILFLLVALAGQLGYLDRVAFRAGKEEPADPQPPLGWPPVTG